MSYEIVPARLEHIRHISQQLRPLDRAEIEGLGLNVRHILHFLYRDSPIKMTAMIRDRVAVVWGVQGSLLSPIGQAWLFTTPLVETVKFAFFRECRCQLTDLLKIYQSLETYVGESYSQSIRFYQMLGFSVSSPELLGPNKLPYRKMIMDRS